ncbi:hypothetical protein CDAR_398601 [Caerostris darwini]|uniref:Uncharacterized protein n=1 Tax=Caerostris darwini TaxID=1538125 RepID=A0AAV4VEP8_9ARAC|nr:hypothetical protein CDAR_398601 [Caerostris darwini]
MFYYSSVPIVTENSPKPLAKHFPEPHHHGDLLNQMHDTLFFWVNAKDHKAPLDPTAAVTLFLFITFLILQQGLLSECQGKKSTLWVVVVWKGGSGERWANGVRRLVGDVTRQNVTSSIEPRGFLAR